MVALRFIAQTLQKEALEIKTSMGLQLEQERKRFETEKQNLTHKLKQLTSRTKQGEHRAIELLKVQEELRTKWQEELTSEKRDLEGQVDKLKKQCLQLKMNQVMSAGHAAKLPRA